MEKYKFGKDGAVRKKGMFGYYKIEDSALACFVCPSLKEILKIFGENIITLKAKGGKQLDSVKEELKTLGIKLSKFKDNSCVINYNKSFSKINKHDDLTKTNIKILLKYLKKYDIADCTVEYLKIKIEDDELKERIEEIYNKELESNIFYVEFELVMCEGDIDRDIWEETPYNKDVLAPLKFKRSILHCIRLVDDGQIWAVKKSKRKYYINWKLTKKSKEIPSSPTDVALSIKKNLEPYGYTKKYRYSKGNKLELVSMK